MSTAYTEKIQFPKKSEKIVINNTKQSLNKKQLLNNTFYLSSDFLSESNSDSSDILNTPPNVFMNNLMQRMNCYYVSPTSNE